MAYTYTTLQIHSVNNVLQTSYTLAYGVNYTFNPYPANVEKMVSS